MRTLRPFKQGKTFLDKRRAWQIQRDTSDSRALFDNLVSRKAGEWDEVRSALYYNLREVQQNALISKPIVEMVLETPYDRFPVKVPSEFILHNIHNGRNYYISTEGYDYPRYLLEIDQFPTDILEQSRN